MLRNTGVNNSFLFLLNLVIRPTVNETEQSETQTKEFFVKVVVLLIQSDDNSI